MIDTGTARDHGTTTAAADKGRPAEPSATQASHGHPIEPVGLYLHPQWWRSRAAAVGMAGVIAMLLMLAVHFIGTA